MKTGCLLVLILALVGCSDSKYYHEFQLDESTFDAETMQMIKEDTGLSIPGNARGLNFAYKPPIDPSFLARIEIPEESLESIKSQLIALKENKIDTSGGLSARIPWWRPSQGTTVIDKQVFYSNGRLLHAILTNQDGKAILYIDWST